VSQETTRTARRRRGGGRLGADYAVDVDPAGVDENLGGRFLAPAELGGAMGELRLVVGVERQGEIGEFGAPRVRLED
jgi:hypothetical protein